MTVCTKCHRQGGRRRPHRPAGFTLLEMVLATALALVLLGGLWGLFSTYTNLFDKGQTRVEQSQLVRSLMQQISTDLRSAIQDPVAGVPTTGAEQGPERRFGLFGSATDLRMDVLQLTPLRANATPVGGVERSDEPGTIARVPELRTIHYQMITATLTDDGLDEPSSGLMRSETDFESPVSEAAEVLADDLNSTADLPGLDDESATLETALQTPASAADDSSLWVPEVSAISWRYFDGATWTTQWNSIQRKALPVAVEVQLQLTQNQRASLGEQPAEGVLEDDLSTDEMLTTNDEVQVAGTVHRLIIDLPGSPAYRKPRPVPSTQPRPDRSPVRRVAPPRWTPQQQTPRGTDQWIRTNSQ